MVIDVTIVIPYGLHASPYASAVYIAILAAIADMTHDLLLADLSAL